MGGFLCNLLAAHLVNRVFSCLAECFPELPGTQELEAGELEAQEHQGNGLTGEWPARDCGNPRSLEVRMLRSLGTD